tara:strand:+ start:15295 stop:16515 length:1221 start_codon:yes stop_codon:yes gene_type:complete
MKADILSIGHELLMGELTDTNAAWIATKLPKLGISLNQISIVGDNINRLVETISLALSRSDLVVTTGGLGPTQDDLTREAVAAVLNETPSVQNDIVEQLTEYFASRGQVMPKTNIKQAHLIPSAEFIPNKYGTAPGWWSEKNGKIIINLPGPPGEMNPLWLEQVEPKLKQLTTGEITLTRTIKTLGMSEGRIDELLTKHFGQTNPYLGIYSKQDGIHLRMISKAQTEPEALEILHPMEESIKGQLKDYIWGFDDDTPSESCRKLLRDNNLTLSTWDGCTGGMLADLLTQMEGHNQVYKGGMVSTDSDIYHLGLSLSSDNKVTSISQSTANQMAKCIREEMDTDIGIGLISESEPTDNTTIRSAMLYISIATADTIFETSTTVPARRITIKRRAANTALIELAKLLS